MNAEEELVDEEELPEADSAEEEAPDARIERIAELIADALQKEDPLEAIVGAGNGDLFLMQYQLQRKLAEALMKSSDSLATLERLERPMNMYVKLCQQVDRYIQWSLRLKKAPGGA